MNPSIVKMSLHIEIMYSFYRSSLVILGLITKIKKAINVPKKEVNLP